MGIAGVLVGDQPLGPGGLRQRLCEYAAMLGHTCVLEALLEHTPPRERERSLVRCARIAAGVAHCPDARRAAMICFVAARCGRKRARAAPARAAFSSVEGGGRIVVRGGQRLSPLQGLGRWVG